MIYSPQCAHHVELVIHRAILTLEVVFLFISGWERKAIRHFQRRVVVETKELPSHKLWQVIFAVLDDFEHSLRSSDSVREIRPHPSQDNTNKSGLWVAEKVVQITYQSIDLDQV